ncbi:helix-turn-helix domain-containing protein [Microvirga pudoricolor]|uniref:helix-turn-helix domain-containing protein n=1 Tax=Microvirga pudoricolor TaxID=2778729 RepID=UPI00195019EC|nr:helix-turn-helix domain-containing protein [Microvirga pudoricolor]
MRYAPPLAHCAYTGGSPNLTDDPALTTIETARVLGLKPKTLENWRVMGIGPAFQKGPGLRGSIRYPLSSLHEWRSRHLQTSTSQTMGGMA